MKKGILSKVYPWESGGKISPVEAKDLNMYHLRSSLVSHS